MSFARSIVTKGALCSLVIAMAGCGPEAREVKFAPAANHLRKFRTAYLQATVALNRPPRNAEEMDAFLRKFATDPRELLTSPADGADLVVAWGADLRTMKQQGDRWPIWVYERNPRDGKRWVLEERHPRELTEEEFRTAKFWPGIKESP